ncbi:uncharacterized protein Z520_05849 [Fonsecaea multimorphosa CBS 102226]|uniref:Uncharacterized protein n=1 Tax=Fonsecaea multimorphosa CBS 102226 TaxID=1442371 RepID=A0A0D2KPC1_9EURO|nr:uncharacterized protein Z520_05849 [Fonsecaea multimorphosa CBS 102226]KIX98548.1 hypothetical protein Z520_05849 [Fonsecaea multimorphosa CBS 102226]OAL24740.1 hypothetical protein AYO22_05529 [Fonsecaea multimorphosa]
MKFLGLATTAAAWSVLFFHHVIALSNVTFYSDSQCSKFLSWKTGPDDGTCTPFPTNSQGFLSFMVTSLDQTCAVTVYGSDVPYCSSSTLFLAPFSNCMTATNVSQFSVDCQSLSVATTAVPSVVPTGAANPTTGSTASSSSSSADTGLSGGAKAGIAIAAAVGGLLLVALMVFLVVRNNRAKRRDMMESEQRILEADSTPAVPPYSYSAEMPPNEKKVPVEMPSAMMVPVEAPGDANWPDPQELPGDYTHSEMEGSSPSQQQQKDDIKTVVSSETKTLVGSDAKLDIKSIPESQP